MKQLLGIRHIFRGAIFMSILSILSIFAQGCVKDPTMYITPQKAGVLLLNIDTPTDIVTSRTATTSTASLAELRIVRGYLYVFTKDGAYHSHEEIFAEAETIKDMGTVKPKISAKILADDDLPTENWVVLILNHEVDESLDPTKVSRSTIDDHFSITGSGVSSASGGGLYDLTTAGTGLPMYGELENWSATNDAMTVRRSVAKLLVQISPGLEGGDNAVGFTTETVTYTVLNRAISGHIKDGSVGKLNDSNTNENPFAGELGDALIDKKTVGESVDCSTVDVKAVSYLYEYSYSTKIIGPTSSMGVLSTPTSYNENSKDRLAIILKVYSESSIRYYRLDLARQEAPKNDELAGTATYLDIERNHQYRIVIKAVHDKGYTTATDAIKGIPSNIDFVLVDEGGGIMVANGNKYAISIGEESPKSVRALTGSTPTISLANEVRYILNSVFNNQLPSEAKNTNNITVYNVTSSGGRSIISATPTLLTSTGSFLGVTLTSDTDKEQQIEYEIKLGSVMYTSEVYTIDWITEAHGLNVMIDGKWITVADRNCGVAVSYNSTKYPGAVEATNSNWYGYRYIQRDAVASCSDFKDVNNLGGWRLPTKLELEHLRTEIGTPFTEDNLAYGFLKINNSTILGNLSGVQSIYFPMSGYTSDNVPTDVGFTTRLRSQTEADGYLVLGAGDVNSIKVGTTTTSNQGYSARCVRDISGVFVPPPPPSTHYFTIPSGSFAVALTDANSGAVLDYNAAKVACEEADSRLPTFEELLTLTIYYEDVEIMSATSQVANHQYWSSLLHSDGRRFAVTYGSGWGVPELPKPPPTKSMYARCVRSSTDLNILGRSVFVSDNIITSKGFTGSTSTKIKKNETGGSEDNTVFHKLQVANEDQSSGFCTWQEAVDGCDNWDHEGYHDWRLPSQKELSLIRIVNSLLTPKVENNKWTSTPRSNKTQAWTVGFSVDGRIHVLDATSSDYSSARCVRDVVDPKVIISNSAMVEPGKSVYFGLDKMMNGDIDNVPWDLEARVIWYDIPDIVTQSGLSFETIGNIRTLKVNTSSRHGYGNALVAVYRNVEDADAERKALWSWHVWVTNYKPKVEISASEWNTNTKYTVDGGMVHTYSGAIWDAGGSYHNKVIMDRDLGAPGTGSTPVSDGSAHLAKKYYGLIYQWGRKDPFSPTENATKTSPGPKMMQYSIENPLTFITGVNLWSTDEDFKDRWGGHTGTKSHYDPCPDGWRVPKKGIWDGYVSDVNFTFSNTIGHEGRIYSPVDAWYPAPGYVEPDGALRGVGVYLHLWTASLNDKDIAYNMFSNVGIFATESQYLNARGYQVRCIQE